MAQNKLVRWLMCGLLIALLALMLPVAALASGGGEGTVVTVDGYQVSLVFAEPAKVGENPFHIQILDGMGMPVRNAQVEINAMPVEEPQQHQENMQSGKPAMAGMDGMAAPAPTTVPESGMSGMGGMETSSTAAPADAMPGMEPAPAVAAETPEAAHPIETVKVMLAPGDSAGEYTGAIAFSAAGHWMLTAHLTINGQALEADFPVDVTGGSAGGVILAGFAGLNAALIGAAAITKRKPVSA